MDMKKLQGTINYRVIHWYIVKVIPMILVPSYCRTRTQSLFVSQWLNWLKNAAPGGSFIDYVSYSLHSVVRSLVSAVRVRHQFSISSPDKQGRSAVVQAWFMVPDDMFSPGYTLLIPDFA